MKDQEFIKALSSAARIAGDDPQKTFAATVTRSIDPAHLSLGLIGAFMPTRELNFGDSLTRRIRKGVPFRTMVPGTEHLADQISMAEQTTFNLDTVIAKIRYSLWELQRGEPQTLEQFRKDMYDALVDGFVVKAFTHLATVQQAHNGGANYVNATGTGLTETNLRTMMEKVLKRAGTVRAIVGTRAALLPVYNMAGFATSPTSAEYAVAPILEEWKRTGRVSQFYGVPLIELPQIYSHTLGNYDTPMLPENLVLVIGDNAGEFILYGDVVTQEHKNTQVEPAEYSLAMYRSYGLIIDRPENIGIIQVA